MSNIDLNYGDINLYILSPWRKRIGLYCSSTTLPLSILIGICLSFSAASSSAQTFGGNGGGSQSGGCIESPGVGGGLGGEVGHDGSDGGARGYCAGSGGGGGGANGGAGGAGGLPNFPDYGIGGAGGAGGALKKQVSGDYNNTEELSGGDGEAGFAGTDMTPVDVHGNAGGGGGGGAGGFGLVVLQKAAIENSVTGVIRGGAGGDGGHGGTAFGTLGDASGGDGGNGGDGGIGIWLRSGDSTVVNDGEVLGGTGGDAGVAGESSRPDGGSGHDQGGDPGAGGHGIYSQSWGEGGGWGATIKLTNTGTIKGGDGGASISQADSYYTARAANGGDGGNGVMGVVNVDNRGLIQGGNASDASEGSSAQFRASFTGANGGKGGAGIIVRDVGYTPANYIKNNGTVIAGNGGDGGDVTTIQFANSGNGGAGGVGIAVAYGATVENSLSVEGGDGGNGGRIAGTGANSGNGGNGGDGIQGGGITVINSGTIKGGKAGVAGVGSGGADGTDGIAVHMLKPRVAGQGNTLELRPGSDIQGKFKVVAEIDAQIPNVFTLGGESSAGEGYLAGDISQTVDGESAYQGFQTFNKIGSSTWTLQGSNDADWTISDGTLQVGDGGHLDDGSTIHTSDGNGGTGFLSYKQSAASDTTFGGKITGDGGFRQAGEGTIKLTNAGNDYTGDTELNAGKISISDDNVLGDRTSALSFNSGLLKITGTAMKSTDKVIKWGENGGGFDIDDVGNTFTVSQNLGGSGSGHDVLIKEGLGTLVLTGTNTYQGTTSIRGGELQIENATDQSLSNVENDGKLTLNSTGTITVQGEITGNGSVTQQGTGTTILAKDNNYSGETIISDGVLQLGNGGQTGSVASDIVNNATLRIDRADDATKPYDFDNKTTGSGKVVVAGSGTVRFTNRDNTYSNGTELEAGTLRIDYDDVLGSGGLTFNGGTLSVGSNFAIHRDIDVTTAGTFDIDAGTELTLTGTMTGNDPSIFDKTGAGRLILDATSGTSGFTGTANVSSGTMLVNSDFGGKVAVKNGGIFGGTGSVGATTVESGGKLIGNQGATLTFNNGLSLDADSKIEVTIGATPLNQAMFNVHGPLDLNGTLDVETNGSAAVGAYRVFDYDGALHGELKLGTFTNASANNWSIQDNIAGEINLLNTGGLTVQYWDGYKTTSGPAVNGGDGFWDATATNWTSEDGGQNSTWVGSTLAIFQAQAGTVNIQEPVSAAGLVFQTDGYTLTGENLTLTGVQSEVPVIQVGYSGDTDSKSWTATIDTVLEGNEGLNKTGNGKLILKQNAEYTGKTTVSDGTLQLGDGGDKGMVDSDIDLTGTNHDESVLVFKRSDVVHFGHSISGDGEVIQRGTGTVIFDKWNSFSGGLTVENGSVQAGIADTAFGSGRVKIDAGATLDLADFNETIGGLTGHKHGEGDGDIRLGSGTLTLNQDRFDSNFTGRISGTGGLVKNGNGTLTLSGPNSYSGNTLVNGGSLVQGAKDAFSSTSAYTVANGATIDLGSFATGMRSLENRGTVDFGGTGGTHLNISGDYKGDNGILVMNTVMGSDDSTTDIMKVTGSTSGDTTIVIHKAAGSGAATVNGIELIDIAGNSGGKFYLQGNYTTKDGQPAILTSSAYAYTLQKGDASGSNTNDWYLVSQYTRNDPDGPNPPACDDPNGCPENPSNPSGPSRFSPAAPVYTSYAASMQALNQLPTLQQRRGDRYLNKPGSLRGSSEAGETDDRAIWARIEGAHNRLEPNTTAGHVQQDINTVISMRRLCPIDLGHFG